MRRLKHADIPVPENLRGFPITEKGYIKPWFVKGDDFRVVDVDKALESLHDWKCWICGKKIKGSAAFVTGPVSAENCVSSEPPCHNSCATYAVQVCPFILLPNAKRREAGLKPEELAGSALATIENPGVYAITRVSKYRVRYMVDHWVAMYSQRHIKSRVWWIEGKIA